MCAILHIKTFLISHNLKTQRSTSVIQKCRKVNPPITDQTLSSAALENVSFKVSFSYIRCACWPSNVQIFTKILERIFHNMQNTNFFVKYKDNTRFLLEHL